MAEVLIEKRWRMNTCFSSYRSLFPVLGDYVHLASCSQGAIAQPISKAIEEYHASLLSVGTNWEESILKVEATRKKFAEFINAEPDEIAIVASASDAISAVATTLSYHHTKNRISLTDLEFPTAGHIWFAQKHHGADVSFIRSQNGMLPLEQYEKEVTERTLLTFISHVSYHNGFTQNLKKISNIVHHKGSLLFVDAYQSAGQVPIDVREMNIDMLCTGTRKYMLGIPGVAFLYIKKELAEQLQPRHTGWFGQEDKAKFDIYNSIYAYGAKRFETGTPCFISIYAAYEALKLLLNVGVEHIHSYLQDLGKFTREFGIANGLKVATPTASSMYSGMTPFFIDEASKVEKKLKEKRILVSSRKDVIRIAPHFYNTKEELEYAINELVQLVK